MRIVFSLAMITALGLVGCDKAEGEPEPIDHSCMGAAPYANPGPYTVGVTTISVGSTQFEIWYPTTSEAVKDHEADVYDLREWLESDIVIDEKDAPVFITNAYRDVPIASETSFPLVLYSHGLGSYRSQSTFLMTHLASWGLVVAAPDHPERGVALLTTTGLPEF